MNKNLLMSVSAMAVAGPLLLGASPADAATKWQYKSTDVSANAEFAFAGTIEGFDGNVHIGHISGSDDGYASASISSWTCEEGSWPTDGYYDDYYDYGGSDDGCTFEDSTYFYSYDGDAEVDINKKLTSGTITGTMTSYDYDYDYGSEETTEVSISFTGEGDTAKTTERYRDGNFQYRETTMTRNATVTGTIGDLDLGDFDTTGTLASTKVSERYMEK